jgi:hypothetical protein
VPSGCRRYRNLLIHRPRVAYARITSVRLTPRTRSDAAATFRPAPAGRAGDELERVGATGRWGVRSAGLGLARRPGVFRLPATFRCPSRNRGARRPIHDGMISGPVGFERILADFAGALWTGELLLASGADVDVFPDELDELVAAFFSLFRPTAQA